LIPAALLLILVTAQIVVIRKYGVWRWFSGHTPDGYHHTNATWLRRADKVLHPTGRAIRWHHLPRLHRAGIRCGSELGVFLLLYGLVAATVITLAVLAATTAAGLVFAAWRLCQLAVNWQHNWKWVRPTHKAVTYELGAPPSRLEIARDRSEVTIGLPEGHVLDEKEQAALAYVVEKRLAIEAPEPVYKQYGHTPVVTFRVSPPPPRTASWKDVATAVATRKPDEIIFGLGKQSVTVSAFLFQHGLRWRQNQHRFPVRPAVHPRRRHRLHHRRETDLLPVGP
jgi:hypothetical protein